MKIVFAGGGTGGSVAPLIAVYQELKKKVNGVEALWLGTQNGPERLMLQNFNELKFKPIIGGKLRRYFSWRNFIDLFNIIIGFIQSFFILLIYRPEAIMSAGSYVAVPVTWAAWLLNIPALIHQQDIRVGLANKLMAPFAASITVTVQESLANFPAKKTILTGSPVRAEFAALVNSAEASKKFYFNNNLPLLVVLGGGTGAQGINELIWRVLPELTIFCNVVHLTGNNKARSAPQVNNYKMFSFLNQELPVLFLKAELVITRAGMATLTELAFLSKPALVIPLPQGHQEENAVFFQKKGALEVWRPEMPDLKEFVPLVKKLLSDKNKLNDMGIKLHKSFPWGAEKKIVGILINKM